MSISGTALIEYNSQNLTAVFQFSVAQIISTDAGCRPIRFNMPANFHESGNEFEIATLEAKKFLEAEFKCRVHVLVSNRSCDAWDVTRVQYYFRAE